MDSKKVQDFILRKGKSLTNQQLANELKIPLMSVAGYIANMKHKKQIGNDFLLTDRTKNIRTIVNHVVENEKPSIITVARLFGATKRDEISIVRNYILKVGNRKTTREMAADLGVKPIIIAGGVAALKREGAIGNKFLLADKQK